jgi:hypothetical protein
VAAPALTDDTKAKVVKQVRFERDKSQKAAGVRESTPKAPSPSRARAQAREQPRDHWPFLARPRHPAVTPRARRTRPPLIPLAPAAAAAARPRTHPPPPPQCQRPRPFPLPLNINPSTPNPKQKQLEFYFSDSNLPKDKFLRAQAEAHPDGLVDLSLLLSFSRMRALLGVESIFF